jgi:hypothetical protein
MPHPVFMSRPCADSCDVEVMVEKSIRLDFEYAALSLAIVEEEEVAVGAVVIVLVEV